MEIKFRAWSKSENKYIYDFSMSNDGGVVLNKCYGTDNYIVEQFTGLKDKDGTEIYEGDILNSKNDGLDGCDIWDYTTHRNLIVKWSDKYCCFTGLSDYHYEDSVYSYIYIKIIGNIHENADLLKGE
jgi:uncharacterized phage protein (TIGR01671 family)